MVDGVMFNRSTKTDDKKLAETLARKWEHEAVQAVVYDGERPVSVHEAIKEFLSERENTGGYENACMHMKRWKAEIPSSRLVRKGLPKPILPYASAPAVTRPTIYLLVPETVSGFT